MQRCSLAVAVLAVIVANAFAGRADGDELAVGELALVRLNVSGGAVVPGFAMCNEVGCSKLELWGVSAAKRELSYKTFVSCDANGWGGTFAKQHVVEKAYPASTVLVVSRRSERELAVWLHGTPSSAATVALAPTERRLYVKEHWWKDISPGNMTVEFLPDRGWYRECANGGVLDAKTGECICPPGFDGPTCHSACGPNRFGQSCEGECSADGGTGCRGRTFLFARHGQPQARICAAGLHGELCDKVCEAGRYGAGCELDCGRCVESAVCDAYTGRCPQGCQPGYHGDSCHDVLTHLTAGPNITNVTETCFHGHFFASQENTAGSGTVVTYQVQSKESAGGDWETQLVGKLAADGRNDFAVCGLRVGLTFDVRVLLMDARLDGLAAVPQVRVTTTGRRAIADLTVFNVSARSAGIAWTPGRAAHFVVHYDCVRLLACTDSCADHAGSVGSQTNGSALLVGLLPGALYNVAVALHGADDASHWETVSFATAFEVPDALPEPAPSVCGLAERGADGGRARTTRSVDANHSSRRVSVRWSPPSSCAGLNGPLVGYRWQLVRLGSACPRGCPLFENGTSGITARPSVHLESLKSGIQYELRVHVANIEGYNPERYLPIPIPVVSLQGSQSERMRQEQDTSLLSQREGMRQEQDTSLLSQPEGMRQEQDTSLLSQPEGMRQELETSLFSQPEEMRHGEPPTSSWEQPPPDYYDYDTDY